MRRLILPALCLALVAPAFAQEASDTLKAVTTRGIVLDVGGGMKIDVTYKPDGTFVTDQGGEPGKWRIEGDKLCVTIPGVVENQCDPFPLGKKSGDTFPVGDAGATVTIK